MITGDNIAHILCTSDMATYTDLLVWESAPAASSIKHKNGQITYQTAWLEWTHQSPSKTFAEFQKANQNSENGTALCL